ncbi:MAG: restriction endonuclease subunit S, partial [Desulfatirhabdiaceae bacterium]
MKYSNRKVQIGEVADSIRNGLSVKQYRDFNGLPITRIETIANGVIDPVRVGYAGISPGEKDEWLLKNGDILISHINSKEHLGKCAIYEESPKHLIHGMNLLNLRLNTQKAYPWFILHILKSPQFRSTLSKITKDSVNQSSFNISSFKELVIPLPPISDQKRIAAILDKADIIR